MTPEQFHELDEQEQAEVIWDGKYIADREDEKHMVLLYKIDNELFVEVYVHKQQQVIKKFVPIANDELLDIYTYK